MRKRNAYNCVSLKSHGDNDIRKEWFRGYYGPSCVCSIFSWMYKANEVLIVNFNKHPFVFYYEGFTRERGAVSIAEYVTECENARGLYYAAGTKHALTRVIENWLRKSSR